MPKTAKRLTKATYVVHGTGTIGSFEQKTGIKINANPRMKISTYFIQHGLPSLGRLSERVERSLAK